LTACSVSLYTKSMTEEAWVAEVAPGDKVWTWWDTGAMGPDQMVATVIRVNKKTLTIEDQHGDVQRVPFSAFVGIWKEGES
jgi:hypothetical protein